MTYEEWHKLRNCYHSHCPDGCEHPQPIILEDRLVCGRCLIRFNETVDMLPCDPTICNEGKRNDTKYPDTNSNREKDTIQSVNE